MTRLDRILIAIAALNGLAAVGFGALAAHAAPDIPTETLLRTGATWQAVHALATMVAIGLLPRARIVSGLFLAGVILFAGSIYALAFGAPPLVGFATPVGGILMMAGWAVLAFSALRGGEAA